MAWLESLTLQGEQCRLEPLSLTHESDLIEAVQDGKLWKLWYTIIPSPSNMREEIARRLDLQKKGLMLPFVIIDETSNQTVGMTSYLNPDPVSRRLEIGTTWYRKSVQRTGLNTKCKELLLNHAFETLNCIAVEFRTHFFNRRSRQAIEKLGAKLDGILRNHSVMPNGTLKDTCIYSIIANEWPTIKAHLNFLHTINYSGK